MSAFWLFPHANSWSNCYTHCRANTDTCDYSNPDAYFHTATVLSTSSFTYYNSCNDVYTNTDAWSNGNTNAHYYDDSGANRDSDTGTYGNHHAGAYSHAGAYAYAGTYGHTDAHTYTNAHTHSYAYTDTGLYPDCNVRRLLLNTCAGSSRRKSGSSGRVVKGFHPNPGRNCGDIDLPGSSRVPVL
jgi:hypothetical protein